MKLVLVPIEELLVPTLQASEENAAAEIAAICYVTCARYGIGAFVHAAHMSLLRQYNREGASSDN